MLLLERIGNYLFPVIFAPVLFIVLFAREILTFWIDASFASHSAIILSWLAVGVLFSSVARIPWTLLIAAHRPDVLGKLPALEVPFYLAFLYLGIRYFGLEDVYKRQVMISESWVGQPLGQMGAVYRRDC